MLECCRKLRRFKIESSVLSSSSRFLTPVIILQYSFATSASLAKTRTGARTVVSHRTVARGMKLVAAELETKKIVEIVEVQDPAMFLDEDLLIAVCRSRRAVDTVSVEFRRRKELFAPTLQVCLPNC